MKVRVITDSGGGLTSAQAKEAGLEFLPLQITVDDVNYLDGVNLTTEQLYSMMEEGAMPQTSLPPLGLAEDIFDRFEQDGVQEAVNVPLSSGLSSTSQMMESTALRHGIKLYTVEPHTTLAVQRYLALAAADLADKGWSAQDIAKRLQEAADDSEGFLIPADLDHLAKGGRLTPMAAKLGGMLKIKPVLRVSKETDGKVDAWQKVRTMNKAIKTAVQEVASFTQPDKSYIVFVMHSGNEEGAALIKEEVSQLLPDAEIREYPINAVIACHTGLGSAGVQVIEKVEEADV